MLDDMRAFCATARERGAELTIISDQPDTLAAARTPLKLPEGVSIVPFYDQSTVINATIRTVTTNLVEGAAISGDELQRRTSGALVADRKGKVTAYASFGLEERGFLFVPPTTEVYEGMIVGEPSSERNVLTPIIGSSPVCF